jgi:hypothetical protein
MLKAKAQIASDITEKWGESVSSRGFAQIPNYLLLANQFIEPRLSPIELLVLVQLVGTWWRKDSLPFPSISTLAIRCGVSGRQIQRAVGELEKRELLKRISRRSQGIIASNAYDLAPLVVLLNRIAKTFPNAFPRKPRSVKLPSPNGTRDLAKPKRMPQLESNSKSESPLRIALKKPASKQTPTPERDK